MAYNRANGAPDGPAAGAGGGAGAGAPFASETMSRHSGGPAIQMVAGLSASPPPQIQDEGSAVQVVDQDQGRRMLAKCVQLQQSTAGRGVARVAAPAQILGHVPRGVDCCDPLLYCSVTTRACLARIQELNKIRLRFRDTASRDLDGLGEVTAPKARDTCAVHCESRGVLRGPCACA